LKIAKLESSTRPASTGLHGRGWTFKRRIRPQRKILLSIQDLEGLIGPILLRDYPGRTLNPMSVQELKDALGPEATNLTITYAANGNQILHVGDKQIEVGPMASNDEIKAAIQNPLIPTAHTKVKMAKSPLAGIGQKIGLERHNAELDATKISALVDELAARRAAATPKVLAGLEAQGQDIGELETFVADLEKATNG
jgi:hypothetical protein